MKIAILASNFIRLPPQPNFVPKGFSGAPEKIMYQITEELVKRNHEVTLFASEDSQTSAKLLSVTPKSTSIDPAIGIGPHVKYEELLISACYKMSGEFDIIHSIFDTKSAPYSQSSQTPTLSTLHNPLTPQRIEILSRFKNTQSYVSISNAQRKPLPDLNYVATIYHGIELEDYPFSPEGSGEYMLNVGRVVEEKGLAEAIIVAKKLNRKLYSLGTPVEKQNYWINKIQPNIDNKLIFNKGFLDKKTLQDYYKNAKLFILPIAWEEPFGLVMIESMASGAPVVAFSRGSVPEIIKDGETGFIVNSSPDDIRGDWIVKKTGIEGLCEAVERIYSMPENDYKQMRKDCRAHVEKNFTVERMVDEYEKVYEQILSKNK